MLIVQCDFDDTITVGNVSSAIREAFGPDDLAAMEEEYLAGRCSVEESNIRQFKLVRAAKEDIEDFVVRQTVIRPAFGGFVDYCRGEGIRLVIVSSGLDLYIEPVIRRHGFDHLETYSAKARATADGIEVKYYDPSGTPVTRGFKESYLRHFQSEGNAVIYVGDGRSDIIPAMEADFVIARSTLEEELRTRNLAHFSFETFVDAGKHVRQIRLRSPG